MKNSRPSKPGAYRATDLSPILRKPPNAISVIDFARGVFHTPVTQRVGEAFSVLLRFKIDTITNRKTIDLMRLLCQTPDRRDFSVCFD